MREDETLPLVQAIVERNQARRDEAIEATMTLTPDDGPVAYLLDELTSEATRRSLLFDPYWPKWDSPWWKVLLLHELGLAASVPSSVVGALAESLENHFITFFPLTEEEIPEGIDPYRNIICHCALGCIYQVLCTCGVAVDSEFPWMRPWFRRYQLPDGGLNCDEQVYGASTPRSSIVSTLPPLEAILLVHGGNLAPSEETFLRRGAQYLMDRRLCRSKSKDMAIMDGRFLRPTVPRYYHYDILRGLAFLARWARLSGEILPCVSVSEVLSTLDASLDASGALTPRPHDWQEEGTLVRNENGTWNMQPHASSFSLLTTLSSGRRPSGALTRQWYDAIDDLHVLLDEARLR